MKGFFRKFLVFSIAVAVVIAITSCERKSVGQSQNFVEWTGEAISRNLNSDGVDFKVISKNLLMKATSQFDAVDTSLILGFPRNLLGQENVFGGVVTAVSDTEDSDLGGLKLADLAPLHVRPHLSADSKELLLSGCKVDCAEGAKQEVLFRIPVMTSDVNFVYLNLASFGSTLDFIKEIAPGAGVEATASRVVRFDFSLSTLVFDVENTYSLDLKAKSRAPFNLTVRWYLKLASAFHSDFTPRKPRPEVGFFTTDRAKEEVITRFSTTSNESYIAKYYIKNVPSQYHAAFADSFDDWNKKLAGVLGKDMFGYEFVNEGDPRAKQIITGDIRYNVIEWDLVNKAGYGGLGPSIANQNTGETFSANVLVQGPTIIELYKKWWKVTDGAKRLEEEGKTREAQMLKADFLNSTKKVLRVAPKQGQAFKLTFQSDIPFEIPSANPRLFDPVLDDMDFFDRPDGYTFETYMYGYFRDMVAHELGHNIGLRHNFRGSLGSDNSGTITSVSRSVMEYLNRNFRYLDRVGPYDQMAIAYGYRGTEPEHKNWFCTDEDVVKADKISHSAECSPNDGTSDPFGFFLARFQRAKDFLILPGSEQAPVWTVAVLGSQVTAIVKELANYYVSSFATADKWTNFVNHDPNVPSSEIPNYILKTLVAEVCDADLEAAISQKTSAGQAVARQNLKDLLGVIKKTTAAYTKPVNVFNEQTFACFKGN